MGDTISQYSDVSVVNLDEEIYQVDCLDSDELKDGLD